MIKQVASHEIKRFVKKKMKILVFMLLKTFAIPIAFVLIIVMLISFITDIFCIGIPNEEKSNMREEVKYYSENSYTDEEGSGFLSSVSDFIDNLFRPETEIIEDSEWPVPGYYRISSYYGKRTAPTSGASTMHSGIDIPAPEGTKYIAIADGIVTKTAWGGAGGFTVTVESGDYSFSYCHSDPNFMVKVGDNVKKGQVIGMVGPKNVYGVEGNKYRDSRGIPTNGATTGCHCHFTVRKNGQTINPLSILKEREVI